MERHDDPGDAAVARRGGGRGRRGRCRLRAGWRRARGSPSSSSGSPQHVGAEHGVAVSSCTTALHLALHLLGIGPGDEVVVPVVLVHRHRELRPVRRRDARSSPTSSPRTATSAPGQSSPCLTERTRAVIVVDQGGVPADLEPLRRLCDQRGIALVEDAACAAGSAYRGAPVGAGGDPRRVVVPSAQAADHRRGRHAHHVGCRAGRPGSAAARARHERQRGRAPRQPAAGDRELPGGRLQLPDDRHPGRGRPGAAGQARRDGARRRELAEPLPASCSADVPGLRTVRDPA